MQSRDDAEREAEAVEARARFLRAILTLDPDDLKHPVMPRPPAPGRPACPPPDPGIRHA